jgi:hypothetical protein
MVKQAQQQQQQHQQHQQYGRAEESSALVDVKHEA